MRHLIVSEGPFAAEAIRRALRHLPGCDVIGFTDGRGACTAVVAREAPDVVIVDLNALSDGLDRIAEIRDVAPEAKIVMLRPSLDEPALEASISAGADAVIAKTQRSALGILIHAVANGDIYHVGSKSAPERDGHRRSDSETKLAALTARELEILRLVSGGMSNARVAAKLWVTEQTVKFHLSNVYRKLGLTNRTEASHYAHVNGMLEDEGALAQSAGGAAAA